MPLSFCNYDCIFLFHFIGPSPDPLFSQEQDSASHLRYKSLSEDISQRANKEPTGHLSPGRDAKLIIYGLEYLRENSRDQLRSYNTLAVVKPRRDSNERGKKNLQVLTYPSCPFTYVAEWSN